MTAGPSPPYYRAGRGWHRREERCPIHELLYVTVRLLKDAILRIPGVARLDEHRHASRTGLMDDPEWVASILSGHLRRFSRFGGQITGLHALELGPGKSLAQAFLLYLLGVEAVTAVDVRCYATEQSGRDVYRRILEGLPGWLEDERFPLAATEAVWRRRAGELLPEGTSFPRLGGPLRYEIIDGSRLPLADDSVALAYSCSVLEHVPDATRTYRELARVLRPGGLMTHIIDLRDHHHPEPFHFLRYGDRLWSWMQGRSAGYTNRLRAPDHLDSMEEAGFSILDVQRRESAVVPALELLAPRFRSCSPKDLRTETLIVTARLKQAAHDPTGAPFSADH